MTRHRSELGPAGASLAFPTSLARLVRGGVAALAAAALLLTGCSTAAPEPATTPSSSAPGLLPPGEGTTSYPLTLKSGWGETVLQKRPERIAVIGGLGDFEATLALGVSPVVAPAKPDDEPWYAPYADALKDATVIDPWADTLAVEKVAAARPDLIVALGYSNLDQVFTKLKAIAPVLAVQEKGAFIPDWRTTTNLIGATLDLPSRASEAIAATDQHIAKVAQDHPQWQGRTVAIVINRGSEFGVELVNNKGSQAEKLLTALGFAPHPNAAKMIDKQGYTTVSLENLSIVDADGIFLYQHGGRGEAKDAAAWLAKSPLYQRLKAVQAGNVAIISSDDKASTSLPWAFSWPNALNLPWTADQLDQAFEGLFAK